MQKLFFTLSLVLYSVIAYASCCSFEIGYSLEIINLPEEETILSCIETERCDSLFLYTSRMLIAVEKGDDSAVSRNFEKALPLIDKRDKGDKTSLQIIYLYASYLEKKRGSTFSSAYYKYIDNNAAENSILQFLAQIGKAGISNSPAGLKRIGGQIKDRIEQDVYTTNEVLSILIRYCNYLDPLEGYSFSVNTSIASVHLRDDLDPELYLKYLDRVIFYLIAAEDERFRDYYSKYKSIYTTLDKEYLLRGYTHLKAAISLKDGHYDRALKLREEILKLTLDPTESVETILKQPPVYTSSKYAAIESYAAANLFQTRVGKGLPPVKKAFDLYEMIHKYDLVEMLTNANGLTADKVNYVRSYEINILIIGTYLYQKTNDVSYLSRAITILDGNIGAGSHFWTTARNYSRSNDSYNEDVMALRDASNSLLLADKEASVSTIYFLQEALKQQKKKIRSRHPDFFKELARSGSIDLNELSDWCAEDNSGVLSLYMTFNVQYRLLVTPDTIDISILQGGPRILTLAEQLGTISDPEDDVTSSADASRELYSLLFVGIDSLLPPNLHIIATGELENVPYNALRREAAGEPARYLGTEIALSRQMSIRNLQALKDQNLNPRYHQPLGMAPDFANESLEFSELRQAGFVLPPLLYNKEEVESLEARGPGNFYYGMEATLPNYLRSASDHSIIHLATHAISSQINRLESKVYLASDDRETSELNIFDIGDLTINADLVVLSACETGSGDQHLKEGRISLTKAYLAAGARSVVSSNWAVDDFATASLMKDFYQHIQEGKPPHQALQLSRIAYLERYPDAPPYKWAAFEAYGGMKSVKWDRSQSKWPAIGFGGLAVFSVGLGALYFRRRRKESALRA